MKPNSFRWVAKLRRGSAQLVATGVVLFFSGAMAGGYIVWNHLNANQGVGPGLVRDTQFVEPETAAAENDPVVPAAASGYEVAIPNAHSMGTKSFVVTVPEANPPASKGLPTPPTTKVPPTTNPNLFQAPPSVHMMGTKSGILVPPRSKSATSRSSFGANPNVVPQAIPFGTKSAPVFTAKEPKAFEAYTEHVRPAPTPLPLPVLNNAHQKNNAPGWRRPTPASKINQPPSLKAVER